MPSNFFTNSTSNALIDKFKGVFENMSSLQIFHAIVGYFRASGYFAIREQLLQLSEVKILVGIDVDNITATAQRKGFDLFQEDELTKKEFNKWLHKDIKEAKYSKEVEESIGLFIKDIAEKRIEIRASKNKKLHAKVYVFLPEGFNEHKDGRVIMGSSNLTSAGLGIKDTSSNYEFNVELRAYDDVRFAEEEFQYLWRESTPILSENLQKIKDNTHLERTFTPFEVYIKFLIEYFGKNVEYDPESVGDLPNNFKKLSYQVDAVNQGFQMLQDHNGFFLADVVGTGKTVMAAMLAKKFIIANGSQRTKILIVYPPALEKNWKRTFKLFNIEKYAHFITNGSLNKIIDEHIDYSPKEEYDLILVDEAHKFRNHRSTAFENLQIICKAGRLQNGMIEGTQKKVVLISATPLNNHPRDIYYLLQLFQNSRNTTLPNVPNLQKFFNNHFENYDRLKRMKEPENEEDKAAFYAFIRYEIQAIYTDIRENVIYPITIRRTRADLNKSDTYRKDLEDQKIKFPKIADPSAIEYKLGLKLEKLFYKTIDILTDDERLNYARYQAISHLKTKVKNQYYEQADRVSVALAFIMKTMLVKRLESSFVAFKKSLNNFHRATQNMIQMFNNDNIFIAPDLDVNKLIDEGWTDEEIETKIIEISEKKPGNHTFHQIAFEEEFIEKLKHDEKILDELCKQWEEIKEDPKWDSFVRILDNELFSANKNQAGKLVIFSESKDTTNYLLTQLNNAGYSKVLSISADNRKSLFETILENFDANYEKQKNEYNIILTTEVLAEGINLHRSNIIVNYDTPWNATRLMQRIGRVNRIGSTAPVVYNYNFYPSAQGNAEIQLRKTSYMKLQGFHSAFGEDSRIYTLEEVVEQFGMYKDGMPEDEDIRLQYLEFLRNFRKNNEELFREIKRLPLKTRTARSTQKEIHQAASSIVFLRNDLKKDVYFIDNQNKAIPLRFEEAVKIFEANEKESAEPLPPNHFEQINKALGQFEYDIRTNQTTMLSEKADQRTQTVKKFLRTEVRTNATSDAFEEAYRKIMPLLEEGTYVNLVNDLDRLRKKSLKTAELEKYIVKISERYVSKLHTELADPDEQEEDSTPEYQAPEIIISESFI